MRLRGILTGWLTLVVVYVAVQAKPAGRASGLAGDLTGLLNRALDPAGAGIPGPARRAAAAGNLPRPGGPNPDGGWPTPPPPGPGQTPPPSFPTFTGPSAVRGYG
jgi:hypothetical protein